MAAVAPPSGAAVVPQGLWERWTARRRAWAARHPRLVRALRTGWIAWTVGSLVVYLLALSFVAEWRTATVPWLWSYYALLLVFLAARTKTVSWRFVAGAFSAGALLAPAIGLLEVGFARLIDAEVGFRDGTVLIAGPFEEVLKLTPLLAILVFARRRRRGMATVDFLLVGFASGLGFQAVEDAIRRIALANRAPSLADVFAQLSGGAPGLPRYGWGWLTGGAALSDPSKAFFPGHAVTAAIAAAGIGLGFRLRRRLGPLALLIPVLLLAMVTVDHVKFNDTASSPLFEVPELPTIDPDSLPEGFDLPERPQDHEVDTPAWLDRAWELWGRGRFEPALLTGLLVVGLVLDSRRYRRALPHLPQVPPLGLGRRALPSRPRPPPAPPSSGLERVVNETARSVWQTAVDVVHEAALTLMALGHDPGPQQQPAWRRWLVGLAYLRGRRELAQRIGDEDDRQRSRRGTGTMLLWALVAGALTAAVLVALWTVYGTRLGGGDGAFLAGLLEDFADWWNGLSWGEQMLVLVGVTGLLTLGFGVAFWPAFYWVGAASLVPQHGYGLAESIRDPAGIDDRLANLTPGEIALYTTEGVLTFWGGPGAARTGTAWRRQLDHVAEREMVQRAVPAAEQTLPDIAREAQIQLGGLDELGRATGATAHITPDILGAGTRPRPGIDPPGLDTSLGHARGHLVARQLGGDGRDLRNLVTLFQTRTNSPEMRGFENMVRQAVAAGETVQYEVVPLYRGRELLPVAVTLHAEGSRGFSLWVTVLNRGS